MRVDELMSAAKCCGTGDTVRECATLMKTENIGFVPVCGDAGEPVGAITDRDLVIRVLADGRSADEPVEAFMTRDVVSCRAGVDADEAARLMRDHRMSRVMVCDDGGRLVGVVSLHDIAEIETEEEVGETLQEVKSDQPPAAH